MKKALSFWVAFFLALGSMISFMPRTTKARDIFSQKNEIKNGVGQHFEATWKHLAKTVNNHG